MSFSAIFPSLKGVLKKLTTATPISLSVREIDTVYFLDETTLARLSLLRRVSFPLHQLLQQPHPWDSHTTSQIVEGIAMTKRSTDTPPRNCSSSSTLQQPHSCEYLLSPSISSLYFSWTHLLNLPSSICDGVRV